MGRSNDGYLSGLEVLRIAAWNEAREVLRHSLIQTVNPTSEATTGSAIRALSSQSRQGNPPYARE